MLSYKTSLSLLSAILALSTQVNAHGFITDVEGANGKKGQGFGVDLAQVTPGNQGPTSSGFSADAPCGRGGSAGQINVASSIEAAITAGLPTVGANGEITMNWQQVNAGSDGGGPGNAFIDVSGTGANFVALDITKNFGDNGADSRNPMTVKLPAGTSCTGGSTKNVCLIKVTNPAGPFGSCIAVQSPGGGGGNDAGAGADTGKDNGKDNDKDNGNNTPPPAQGGGNNDNGGNNNTPPPPPPPPAQGGGGANGACDEITVQPGDTCNRIAKIKGVTVNQILQANSAVNAGCTNLRVGQKLCMSSAGRRRAFRRNSSEFAESMQAKREWLKMTLAGL